MNRLISKMVALLVRGVAPAAAITLGLPPDQALCAPGDLDPSFGSLGRVGPLADLKGTAWSIQPLSADSTLVAGGDVQCEYFCFYSQPTLSAFFEELSGDGSVNPGFQAQLPSGTRVLDSAQLSDGSLIGVGESREFRQRELTVFRLERSGALDNSFGTTGVFRWSGHGESKATSVGLDASGRIIVAGAQSNPIGMIVLRLLPNGVIDESFGQGGVYTGPPANYLDTEVQIAATGSGYRLVTSDCKVIALTADGKLDLTFGTAGVVPLKSASGTTPGCDALAVQPDGQLLVGGFADAGSGFATRLLPNGVIDTTFGSAAIAAGLGAVTALGVTSDGSGSIIAAGSDPTDPSGSPDAVVMRLQPNGLADASFGRAGTTLINLPTEAGSSPPGSRPVIHDLYLRPDGGVVAGGVDILSDHPFVVRLLGANGAGVPGVIGASQNVTTTDEQSHEVVVKFRRTGGNAGTVSVAYQTVAASSASATAGQDYDNVSGRLTWNDGDVSEQEVHVPILADKVTEESEYFGVALSDFQGGAGVGTGTATIEIEPDGKPYGQFGFSSDRYDVFESGTAEIAIDRNFYTSGAVSVTVTPVAGTASANSDFDPKPVTVSWADGEGGTKYVTIAIPDDTIAEPDETFSVTLSSPTGGALIGPHSTTSVVIATSDQPPPPSSNSGGTGSFGFLSLLMLAASRLIRSAGLARREQRGRN